MHITHADIAAITGGRLGVTDAPCPDCGPDRRTPLNRRRRVLRIWAETPGWASYHCARCGLSGHTRDPHATSPDPAALARIRAESARRDAEHAAERLRLSIWLWRRSRPAIGSPVVSYLRSRGIECAIPGTVRYLPAHGDHPHSMIASFGIATEPVPGVLAIHESAIRGVHLTALAPDGRGKAFVDPAKKMLGQSLGSPICLAPPNDGLGLAIGEGIETVLSFTCETGVGGWTAGAAGRLPALAEQVPSYIESITILAEPDPAGQRGAYQLAERLSNRSCEIRVIEADHGS